MPRDGEQSVTPKELNSAGEDSLSYDAGIDLDGEVSA